jgi:hypothetical protein
VFRLITLIIVALLLFGLVGCSNNTESPEPFVLPPFEPAPPREDGLPSLHAHEALSPNTAQDSEENPPHLDSDFEYAHDWSPTIITTAEELEMWFRFGQPDMQILLAADIVAPPNLIFQISNPYTDIGDGIFHGIFDGGGHTITVDVGMSESDYNSIGGLFVEIGSGGIVRNVNIAGSVIGRINQPSQEAFTGGVTGRNRGLIENVTVSADVSGSYVGGIVGLNGQSMGSSAVIRNAHSTGNITGHSTIGTIRAGGIAGGNYGSLIENASFSGTVTVLENERGFGIMPRAGGIAGTNDAFGIEGNIGIIRNSRSTGQVVSHTHAATGDIVGFSDNGSVVE